jgi:hypothetical protein
MPQCHARSKRSGAPCKKAAMQGMTVCYHHGGASRNHGAANSQYKHGRYSKVLPVRLQQRYEEARANPGLLSVREDVAVCESRLAELFARVESGESGAVWQALRDAVDGFQRAMALRDVPTMQRQLDAVSQLVRQGRDDYEAWGEIQRLWETRCKLTLTEHKMLVGMRQMVTIEQLMTYFGVICDAITRIVPLYADPDVARQILGQLSTEFHRISVLEHGAEA